MKKNISIHWFFRLLGMLLFLYILLKLDLNNFTSVVSSINMPMLAIAVPVYLLIFPVKAFRWHLLNKKSGIRQKYGKALLQYLSATFIGLATPGRLGDFSKVMYFPKKSESQKNATVTTILDRLYDLIFLFTAGILLFLLFDHPFQKKTAAITLLLFVLLVVMLLILINPLSLRSIILFGMQLFIPKRFRKQSSSFLLDSLRKLQSFTVWNHTCASVITLTSWTLYYISTFLLAKALNIHITFVYLTFCVILFSIITMIPVSISGIGTRDAASILLFAKAGIKTESAVVFSSGILFFFVIAAIIGFLAWTVLPMKKSR